MPVGGGDAGYEVCGRGWMREVKGEVGWREENPNKVEEDGHKTEVGLRSDMQHERSSVFSRLNGSRRKNSVQDYDDYISDKDHADMSVTELLDVLHHNQAFWRGSTHTSQEKIQLNEVDAADNKWSECEDDADPLASEEEQDDDVVIPETLVTFKSRKQKRKMQQVQFQSDGLRKRRKLIRPCFVSEKSSNSQEFKSRVETHIQELRSVSLTEEAVSEDVPSCSQNDNGKVEDSSYSSLEDENGKA